MKVSAGKSPNSQLALVAAAISVILLLTAPCAQGETVDEGVASLTSTATEGVSPDAASAEPAAGLAPPTEAPVETQESESAIESAGTAVESVAAAPSRVAAASQPVREAASETVREATGAVSSSATTDSATTVVTAIGDRASKLVGEVGQVPAKAAAAVDDRTQQLSGLSEGAGAKVAGAAAFGNPPRIERLLQPAGTPPSGVLTSPGESPASASPVSRGKVPSIYGPARPLGVLPRVHASGGALPARHRGFAGAKLSWLAALESFDGIQSTPTSGTTDARSNGPTPLDRPTPAPGSSAAAAGSTGSFFVPLAALLALLALVAPATLRRLGEVSAFRPPVPFVCALERPG